MPQNSLIAHSGEPDATGRRRARRRSEVARRSGGCRALSQPPHRPVTGSSRARSLVRRERRAEPRFAAPILVASCGSFAIPNKPIFAGSSCCERGSFRLISACLLLPNRSLCPWGRRCASATCHPRAFGPRGTTVDRTLRSERSGPEKCLGPGVGALRPAVMRPSWLPLHMPLSPSSSKSRGAS